VTGQVAPRARLSILLLLGDVVVSRAAHLWVTATVVASDATCLGSDRMVPVPPGRVDDLVARHAQPWPEDRRGPTDSMGLAAASSFVAAAAARFTAVASLLGCAGGPRGLGPKR
jgi:hypothetical protein